MTTSRYRDVVKPPAREAQPPKGWTSKSEDLPGDSKSLLAVTTLRKLPRWVPLGIACLRGKATASP